MEAEDLLQGGQDFADEVAVSTGRDVGEGRLEEPQGRIDGVVLGRLAPVGESIRQKSTVAVRQERADDVAGLLEAALRQEEAGKGDHRVAAPVREPRIA